MSMYKIWSADRQNKRSVVASNMHELISRGSHKLGVSGVGYRLVDESDGTDIDDDEVLGKMAGKVMLLLGTNENWIPASTNPVMPTKSMSYKSRSSTVLTGNSIESTIGFEMTPKAQDVVIQRSKDWKEDKNGNQNDCCKEGAQLELVNTRQELSEDSPVLQCSGNTKGVFEYWKEKEKVIRETELKSSEKTATNIRMSIRTQKGACRTSRGHHNQSTDKNSLIPSMPQQFHTPKGVCRKISDDANDENNNMAVVMGELPTLIRQSDYLIIRELVNKPQLMSAELKGFVSKVIPYILQRIKMRGCSLLSAGRVSSLVQAKSAAVDGAFSRSRFNSADPESPASPEVKYNTPISRLDCLTGLLNSVDAIVACDLLMIMSQFPLALPLVMRSVKENKYMFLTPFLRGIVLKWEAESSGKIVEHSLFNDRFRLIVAVRVGQNDVGKSTILNQVLAKEHTFSSAAEPGAEYGRPASMEGSVEFIWLTQETCKDAFWTSTLREFYSQGNNEVALLANLHGDANNYRELLSVLSSSMSCGFLIFVMPTCSNDNWNGFLTSINSPKQVTVIDVDSSDKDSWVKLNSIQTAYLASDATLSKVREALKDALFHCQSQVPIGYLQTKKCDNLTLVPSIETPASVELIKLVEKSTCKGIKETMQLQTRRPNVELTKRILHESESLRNLISLLGKIFSLPQDDLQRAVIHLEKNLSRISRAESQDARTELCKLEKKLHQALVNEEGNKIEIERLQRLTTDAVKQLNGISLGLEHFVREIAQHYEFIWKTNTYTNSEYRNIPEKIAQLLIDGHPIELLDGDAEDIPFTWFNAICKKVSEKYPNLRVYVVSILGLQSSGKSTLLNSLFACRFAVSVGRCSRGLFMRLLFLDANLAKNLKCDAILLIDTEGLSAPEKINVADGEKKDRLLATFAMAISNLTIINVLGENIKDLTEILQIAILTMTRLETVDVRPDILMVQHLLTERDTGRTLEGQSQFCEAINAAVVLTEKNKVHVGVRNSRCLALLRKRVKDGTLLLHFHPYKDGASANSPPSEAYHNDVVCLREKILASCRTSSTIIKFTKWKCLVESYWSCVSKQDFSLRFKNAKEIYDFIERQKRIETVKQSINTAFTSHSKTVKKDIEVKANDMANDSKSHSKENIERFVEKAISSIPAACDIKCADCAEATQQQVALFDEIRETPHEQDVHKTINDYRARMKQLHIKMHLQTWESAIVQHCCSVEFDEVITKHLKDEFMSIGPGNYNSSQRMTITDKILNVLIAKTKQDQMEKSVREEVIDQLQSVYYGIPDIVQAFETQVLTFEKIFDQKNNLLSNFWQKILRKSPRDIKALKSGLLELLDKMISEADYFQETMVGQLQRDTDAKLETFKVQDESTKVHVWIQQIFCKRAEELQMKWDRKNKPSLILEANLDRYRNMIRVRLNCGFTSAAEAIIIADYLWEQIQENVVIAMNVRRVQTVKAIGWTINSERVRLKYFKELAVEVERGDRQRALRHFVNPREEIEKWFVTKVNGFCNDNSEDRFSESKKNELQQVINLVNTAKNLPELISTVKEYLNNSYNPREGMEDFGVLKDSILQLLELQKKSDKESTDDHSLFSKPSDDDQVMLRLGCTFSCYWCGALCWGPRDHHKNSDETKKHHASHQPSGLIRVSYKDSHKLVSRPCHEITDDIAVYFGDFADENGPGCKWSIAKKDHFSDWIFDKHCISKFDEMMKWFFQELHVDLSKTEERLNPATDDDLSKYGCYSLNFTDIMSRIEQEIN